MRRNALIIAALAIVTVIGPAQAVDLEAGWYVKLGGVAVWGFDPKIGRDVGYDWNFEGGIGMFGPFEVTQPHRTWPQRMVSVPSAVTGVAPGTAVYLSGAPTATIDFQVDRIDVSYDTLYDPSAIVVQALVLHSDGTEEVLWSHLRSGHAVGSAGVLGTSDRFLLVGDSVAFRVVAVPEPAGAIVLLTGAPLLAALSRRSGRC
jgi:hypothetical protein